MDRTKDAIEKEGLRPQKQLFGHVNARKMGWGTLFTRIVCFSCLFRLAIGGTAERNLRADIFDRTAEVEAKAAVSFPSYYVHTLTLHQDVCGGTLIAPDIVLAAADCQVAFGSSVLVNSNRFGGGRQVMVDFLFAHPTFDPETGENDIMLVKLMDVISDIPLVNLAESNAFSGQILDMYGFAIPQEKRFSDELKQISIKVQDKCDSDFLLCAYHTASEVCVGLDSGSPLVDSMNKVQYGVASLSRTKCGLDSTLHFTPVANFQAWIEDFVCEHSAMPPFECASITSDAPSYVPSSLPTELPTSTNIGPVELEGANIVGGQPAVDGTYPFYVHVSQRHVHTSKVVVHY